jgi:hypothetical protein
VPPDREDLAPVLRDPVTFCSGIARLNAHYMEVMRATGTAPASEPRWALENGEGPRASEVGMLEAILDEIERFVPGDFRTLDEARSALAEAARRAPDPDARPLLNTP